MLTAMSRVVSGFISFGLEMVRMGSTASGLIFGDYPSPRREAYSSPYSLRDCEREARVTEAGIAERGRSSREIRLCEHRTPL